MNAGHTREQFGFRLSRLARIWRQRLDICLGERGIGYSNWTVLVYLQRGGEGMQQRELADFMGIEAPSLVPALDQLERLALIERRPHPADRRAKAVHLTEAGRTDLVSLNAAASDVRAQLLAGIDDAELERCLELIDRVTDNALRLKGRK